MRLPSYLRIGATARIALGLVSLALALVLALDLVFKIFPDPRMQAQQVRERTAIDLAVQVRTFLTHQDMMSALGPMLEEIQSQANDIVSIGVRRADGVLVVATKDHARTWQAPSGGLSTLTAVQVPLYAGSNQRWGMVELQFNGVEPRTFLDWLRLPTSIVILTMSSVGFAFFYLYLRRVLQHLDPSQTIPERVRAAFDSLSEGLLVLDVKGQILLANRSFKRMHPMASVPLIGHTIDNLDWLTASLHAQHKVLPWTRALGQSEPILGVPVELSAAGGEGESKRALLNCVAIRDAAGSPRGCMVTLDDVTELDKANSKLRLALAELETSRNQIQRQNDELQLLANCDPLTGCFNRRAFFARADELVEQARTMHEPLCCVMADIDHFKKFNDTHGHAVGDQVIQQVAKILRSSMRTQDVLCRYGGEEFCMLLPSVSLAEAMEIANRIRARIERDAGPGVRTTQGLHITSSFGVARFDAPHAATILKLIERADQGLYAAKMAGRNQVQCLDLQPA